MTTRRSVVKTGAKLAYTVPLVAATMKLGTSGTAAISGGSCLVDGTACATPSVDLDVCRDCCHGSVASGAFGRRYCGPCVPSGASCYSADCQNCCQTTIWATDVFSICS